jgi:hypothetical protein
MMEIYELFTIILSNIVCFASNIHPILHYKVKFIKYIHNHYTTETSFFIYVASMISSLLMPTKFRNLPEEGKNFVINRANWKRLTKIHQKASSADGRPLPEISCYRSKPLSWYQMRFSARFPQLVRLTEIIF